MTKDIKRNNPELEMSIEESAWACEVNSDNYSPECPPLIRDALVRREEQMRLSKPAKFNQSNPRKNRGKSASKKKAEKKKRN